MKLRSVEYKHKTGEFVFGMLSDGHEAYADGISHGLPDFLETIHFFYNEEAELDLFPEEESNITFTREEIKEYILREIVLPKFAKQLEDISKQITLATIALQECRQ